MALFQVNQSNAVSNASSGIGSSVSGIGSNVASHSNFDGENLPEVQQAATGSVPAAAAAVPVAGANGSAAAAVGANAPAAVPIAAPQVKNVNVSSMTVEEKIKYVLREGKGIANRAFEKVKTKFFNDSMPIDGKKNGRISEKNALDSLKTISDVQEYKRELVKKLEKAEQDVINAPEKASSPNNGPKLKGAMIQNRNAQKKYNDLLMPVLHVLESKMIASNTLLTLSPLEVKYHTLSEKNGDDDLEVKRQKAIFYTALKQYATEIKNVIDGVDDAEIKKDLDNIQVIVDALEKEASSAPLLHSNGTTPLANHSKKPAGPIGVTVPIKNKDGIIEYTSYQMDNGVFSKLDRPIEDNKAVEDKFKEAVKSAKEGTKVVKMTYKDEPLIVSMNISHPNQSIEKANMNMQNALKKEAQTFVPSVTTNNGMTRPGRTENINLSSLSMNELETAQKKVQKDIDFVNTNTKVAPQNKETLKKEIQRSRMMPINAAIAMKARQRGGKTAKKSKKNNKTKKSTRRSS